MGGLEFLLPLLILLPLLLITFRGRKQQKAFMETQSRLATGQEVMTTAGLYGRIVSMDGDAVVLQVADGVALRWAKPAIAKILDAEPGHGAVDVTKHDTPADRQDG